GWKIIDRASDAGLKTIGRKPGDGANAGLAGRHLGPVVGLAGTKRCEHTEAGHDHDRPSLFIFCSGHQSSPSAGALDQCKAFATPVADAGDQDLANFAAQRMLQPSRAERWKQTTM